MDVIWSSELKYCNLPSSQSLTFGSLEKSFRLLLNKKRPLFVAR